MLPVFFANARGKGRSRGFFLPVFAVAEACRGWVVASAALYCGHDNRPYQQDPMPAAPVRHLPPAVPDPAKDAYRMTHWTLSADPHASREAHKYDNPAPSPEYLLARLEEYGKPLTQEKISRLLGLDHEELHEAVRRWLAAMQRDSRAVRHLGGAYAPMRQLQL